MSKTISSTICETNKALGLSQENVFFHSLYRLPGEYANTFVRSAKSTSPLQISAIFSAQGSDNVAASSLQQVINAFSGIVKQMQAKAVIDYELFTTQVVDVLNNLVCNISISNNGAPLRVSCTIMVIEGDILRIMSVGNTRAYLCRKGKVVSLTEDQTVAHRYVQLGAITKEAENTHPERNVLTQYLGRFPQDGPVVPEKKVHFKLQDDDEIILFGVGIAQNLQPSVLGFISTKPTTPETKASEFISAAMQSGAKGGLTAVVFKIESILVMQPQIPLQSPSNGIVPAASAPAAVSSYLPLSNNQNVAANQSLNNALEDDPQSAGTEEAADGGESIGNDFSSSKTRPKWKKILIEALIGLGIFLCCFLIGYGTMFVIMNYGNWTKSKSPVITGTIDTNDSMNTVMYSLSDHIAVFAEESLDSAIIQELSRGEAVTLVELNDSFSKVITGTGNTGYVVTAMLSETDPTLGESYPEMSADPTPIPEYVEITPSPTPESTVASSDETELTTESSDETSSSETSETTTSETTSMSETSAETTPATTQETTAETTVETTASATSSS